MQKRLIAFVPGKKTGYAVFEINRNINLLFYGSFPFEDYSAVGTIIDLFEKYKPIICVVEDQYLSNNFDSVKKLIEQKSAISSLAYILGAKVYRIHPKTWQANVLKNFGFNIFTGKQNLKKYSKKVCALLYDIANTSSDDVSNAILIGHYVASKILIEQVLTQKNKN